MQSWNAASKDGDRNDNSVCTSWGMTVEDVWLIDVVQRRSLYPELKRKVRELAELNKAGTVLIEEAGSGTYRSPCPTSGVAWLRLSQNANISIAVRISGVFALLGNDSVPNGEIYRTCTNDQKSRDSQQMGQG